MTSNTSPSSGIVYLVGAGPGDPGLITLLGVERLRRADVVLYDSLVNPVILRHAKPDAELICVGKHGHSRIWTQEEINERLVELGQSGKVVVRLKGGDPAVFARSAEEIDALVRHKLPFEIVPGITAALAAGSYAGIPITHRELASAVALITGHESPDKEESALDFPALAKFPGTLVFYMGVTTAPKWSQALIAAGKPADTPVAIVRRCSFPDQLRVHCTLGELTDVLSPAKKIRPPILVIIGQVTNLAATYSWFDKRPLFGQRILVTRPIDQAAGLSEPLRELGADVIEQPAITITATADVASLDASIERLSGCDWVVFSSANGVRFFVDRVLAMGLDVRCFGQAKIAAIGPGTADELRRYHLRADLQPEEFRAESLVEALRGRVHGRRCLLVRASRGREVLAEGLISAGAQIEQVVAYQSLDVHHPNQDVVEWFGQGKIDWVTVTSSAIARSLSRTFGDLLKTTKLASISPVTSATLRELGLEPTVEAQQYTMPGIVAAIQRFHS